MNHEHNGYSQYVIFDLSGETYGIPVVQVKEIITFPNITRVPRAPAHVEGIVNLRGNVITVTNLHKRLGLDQAEITRNTRIIVVEGNAGQDALGMIVDSVTEVVPIPEEIVESPSELIGNLEADYIRGVANREDRLILLLDLDRVLSHN